MPVKSSLCSGSQWEACFVKRLPRGDSEAAKRAGVRGMGTSGQLSFSSSSHAHDTGHMTLNPLAPGLAPPGSWDIPYGADF